MGVFGWLSDGDGALGGGTPGGDIVGLLRTVSTHEIAAGHYALLDDAAAEIERLRDGVVGDSVFVGGLGGVVHAQVERIRGLEAEVDGLRSLIVEWADADDVYSEGLTDEQHDSLESAYDALRQAVGR